MRYGVSLFGVEDESHGHSSNLPSTLDGPWWWWMWSYTKLSITYWTYLVLCNSTHGPSRVLSKLLECPCEMNMSGCFLSNLSCLVTDPKSTCITTYIVSTAALMNFKKKEVHWLQLLFCWLGWLILAWSPSGMLSKSLQWTGNRALTVKQGKAEALPSLLLIGSTRLFTRVLSI